MLWPGWADSGVGRAAMRPTQPMGGHCLLRNHPANMLYIQINIYLTQICICLVFVYFLGLQEPLRLQPIRAAPSVGLTVGLQPTPLPAQVGHNISNKYIHIHIYIHMYVFYYHFLLIKATWRIASAAIWQTRLA